MINTRYISEAHICNMDNPSDKKKSMSLFLKIFLIYRKLIISKCMEEKFAIISNTISYFLVWYFTNMIYEIAIILFLKKYKKRKKFQMNFSHVESNQSTSPIATQSGSTEGKTYNIKVSQQELRLVFYFLVSNNKR